MTLSILHRSILLLALLSALALPVRADAQTQLIMLEQPGCPWCAKFNVEIAPAWPRTAEGMRAPLRRVDITQPWPDDLPKLEPERFTPTFILINDGKELGRLRGYPGDEFFWFQIGELIDRLPKD